jgi:hypothetical protein
VPSIACESPPEPSALTPDVDIAAGELAETFPDQLSPPGLPGIETEKSIDSPKTIAENDL